MDKEAEDRHCFRRGDDNHNLLGLPIGLERGALFFCLLDSVNFVSRAQKVSQPDTEAAEEMILL